MRADSASSSSRRSAVPVPRNCGAGTAAGGAGTNDACGVGEGLRWAAGGTGDAEEPAGGGGEICGGGEAMRGGLADTPGGEETRAAGGTETCAGGTDGTGVP